MAIGTATQEPEDQISFGGGSGSVWCTASRSRGQDLQTHGHMTHYNKRDFFWRVLGPKTTNESSKEYMLASSMSQPCASIPGCEMSRT